MLTVATVTCHGNESTLLTSITYSVKRRPYTNKLKMLSRLYLDKKGFQRSCLVSNGRYFVTEVVCD